MSRNTISSFMVTGVAFALLGCGGGSSSSDVSQITKVIVDDPIAGLNYQCSSSTEMQKTNAQGEFTCNEGDNVTFYLGSYEIGSANTSAGTVDTMRIVDLGLTDEAVTDVRQLLQTIDNDGDGILEIPDDFNALDEVSVRPGDVGFDSEIGQQIGHTLISEEEADMHADEAYVRHLLAGKTLYTTIYDETGTLESWSFASDMSSSNWQEMVGGTATGSGALSISGMTLTYTCRSDSDAVCENTPTTIEIKEVTTDYILVEVRGGELGDAVEVLKLYFTEEKAREELNAHGGTATTTDPATLLDNIIGSWYLSDVDGQVTVTFFSDGSYVLVEKGVADSDGQSGMERGTFQLDTETGTLTASAQVDTNGEWGLSNPREGAFGIEITNNQLTFIEGTDRYVATRVEHVENTIVGSWYYKGDTSEVNKLIVLTFLADGTYMMLEDGLNDQSGQDGIEVGTYTWNSETGALDCNINVDTNGEWGLSDVGTDISVTVQNDTLTFSIPNEDNMDFIKVPY